MLDNLFTPTHLIILLFLFGMPTLVFFAVRAAMRGTKGTNRNVK